MSHNSLKFSEPLPQKILTLEDNIITIKTLKSEEKIKSQDQLKTMYTTFNVDPDEEDFSMKFTELSNAGTNFSFRQFLEFSIYHLLFFLVLGPLLSIFLIVLKKNTILVRNMGFWGFSMSFCMQTFVFLINFVALFGFLYVKPKAIHTIEVVGVLGSTLIRSFVISTKYAYFSAKMCEFYKQKLLLSEETSSELLLAWANQDEKTIEKEFRNTLKRNYIDIGLFNFFFLKPIKDELLDKNSENKFNNDDVYQLNELKQKESVNKKKYVQIRNEADGENVSPTTCFSPQYEGTLIAKYLIKKSKSNDFLTKHPFILSFFLSFLRATIPSLFRMYETGNLVSKTNAENLLISCFFIGNLYFFWTNCLFIIHGIVEYQRLVKLLSQLTNLISLSSVEKYKVRKEFPTINVFCSISFGAWYSLNKLFRDYGKRFFNRIDIHLGVFLSYYLIMALLNIMLIYKIIAPMDFLVFFICGYEMFVMFVAIMGLIWKGVVINDHYSIHKELLNTLKEIVNKFMNYGDHYFGKVDFDPEDEIFFIGKTVMIERMGPLAFNKSNREEYLKTLLNINDFVQGQLTYDETKKPFKILGITADKPLFQKIIAGLGSLATVAGHKLSSLF